MPIYRVKLLKRETVAEGTMAFYFEKPADFTFKPGQFGEWKLLNPPYEDAEGNNRPFSFASAPHEPELMIATRMGKSAFKKSLYEMPVGTEIELDGPYGSFVLHENAARPAVILTGGIGITPFRSMVAHAAEKKLLHKIFLFYSNRRPEDAAFLEELQGLATQNQNYKFIATMTDPVRGLLSDSIGTATVALGRPASNGAEKWERGYITKEMIQKYVDNLAEPIYYSAGPPQLVATMWQMLVAAGISFNDIRTEEFPGY